MKVKFIKDHLEFKKGQVIEVLKERGKYFELVKVATEVKTPIKKKAVKKPVRK